MVEYREDLGVKRWDRCGRNGRLWEMGFSLVRGVVGGCYGLGF